MDFNEYINEKVIKFFYKLKESSLDLLDPKMESFNIDLAFYAINSDGDNIVIPIGTKDEKRGLAKTERDLVLVFNEKDYSVLFCKKSDIIRYSKDKKEDIEKKIGYDFDTMCLVIDYNKFKEFLYNQ